MSKKLDWDLTARRTKAAKPSLSHWDRAPSKDFNAAYLTYCDGERRRGKRPMSRNDWKTAVFDTLRDKL